MADSVQTFDSQAQWEAGEMRNAVALDPAGKLSIAPDSDQVAQFIADNSLAVYCRCSEGSGSTAANLGGAGDATLADHAWVERSDGRHYLQNGSATIVSHASMDVVSDTKYYNTSAGIAVQVASLDAQVFMARAGCFSLGINADGKPYVTTSSQGITITSPNAISVDTWYSISFTAMSGSLMLYVNSSPVARGSTNAPTNHITTQNLSVTVTGLWTDFWMCGDGANANSLCNHAASGTWRKQIDLGATYALRHIEVDTAKSEDEHSLSVQVAFADAEDDLDAYRSSTRYGMGWTLKNGANMLFPPEELLRKGQWVEIRVQMGAADWQRTVPLVDKLVATFRPLGTIDDQIDDVDEDQAYASVLDYEEVKEPEDIAAALKRVRELEMSIVEIKRHVGSYGRIIRNTNNAVNYLENIVIANPAWDDDTQGFISYMMGENNQTKQQYQLSYIFGNKTNIGLLWAALYNHVANVTDAHGIGALASTEDLATHAALATGVHGVESPYYIYGEVSDYAHGDVGTGLYNTAVDYVAHRDSVANPHSAANAGSGFEAGGAVSAHSGLSTNVHGCTSSSVACLGDIQTVITAQLVNGQSIDNRIDALISDHEGSGSAHGSVESNFASHKDAGTGVHGVGISTVASQSWVYNNYAEYPHTSSAHTVTYATVGELTSHASDTTNIHGITNTAVLLTSAHLSACGNYSPT